jgi:hypothetical protein
MLSCRCVCGGFCAADHGAPRGPVGGPERAGDAALRRTGRPGAEDHLVQGRGRGRHRGHGPQVHESKAICHKLKKVFLLRGLGSKKQRH